MKHYSYYSALQNVIFANNIVGTTLLETTLGGNREQQMSFICLFDIDFLRNFVKLKVCSENKLLALEDSEFLI